MIKITKAAFDKLSSDYKGEWSQGLYEWRNGDFPKEWIGRKTMLSYDKTYGTTLLTEGIDFEIVEGCTNEL